MAQLAVDDDPILGNDPSDALTFDLGGVVGGLVSGLSVAGSVRGVYDTNLLRRTPGSDGYRLSPVASVRYVRPLGRQRLVAYGTYGRDIFFDVPFLGSRQRLLAGTAAQWQLGQRCQGVVSADYRDRVAIFDDVGFVTNNNLRSLTLGGNANCQIGARIGIGGGAAYINQSNTIGDRAALDIRGESFNGSLSYGSPALGTLSLTAALTQRRFPNRVVLTPEGFEGDSFQIVNYRLGYQRALGSRLRTALGIGYFQTTPRPESQLVPLGPGLVLLPRAAASGLSFDGNLTYTPSPRLSARLLGRRSANASPNLGALVILSTAAQADADYRIGARLNARLGGALVWNTYRNSFAIPGEPARRVSDAVQRVYASLDYDVGRLLSIGTRVTHARRRSDPAVFDFTSTTISLQLAGSFGRTR